MTFRADAHGVCALVDCHDDATEVVTHPYRPEDETALCATHAERVRQEIDAGGEAA